MPNYIALLRGINVGGHKKILMTELRTYFEQWGFTDVITYIQSGNIIFNSVLSDNGEIERIIRNGILAAYGFDIGIWVKERTEFVRITEKNPYSEGSEEEKKVYFVFLTGLPNPELTSKVQLMEFENEEFTITEECIFLYCHAGYGKAKCTNSFFESKLKVRTTARNLRTVKKLTELSS